MVNESAKAEDEAQRTVRWLADTSGRAPRWFVLLLVVLGLAHAAYFMSRPLTGTFRFGFQSHNAARYAIAGRNYVRHGFAENLGAPDLTPGNADSAARDLYLHHPPAAPLLVGLAFVALGESERSAQLPFFVLGLLVPLAMFLVARRCFPRGGAGPALAAMFCALPPMATLYAGHVDPQGPIVVLAVLLEVWAYLRFRESRRTRNLVLLALAAVMGLFSDFSAAYPLAGIVLADRFMPGGTRDRRVLVLPLVAVVFFLLFLGWIHAIGRASSAELFDGASVRTITGLRRQLEGVPSEQVHAALANAGDSFVRMFTSVLLILAVVGMIAALFRSREIPQGQGSEATPWNPERSLRAALAILLLSGLAHVVLFPQGALVHDYWTFMFLPAFALAAARVVELVRFHAARWEGEGFGVLLALAAAAAVGWTARGETIAMLDAQEKNGFVHAVLGRAIREQVRPNQRVLTNRDCNPTTHLIVVPELTWYADRVMRGGVKTAEAMLRAEKEEGPFDFFVYAPPSNSPPDPVFDALEKSGKKKKTVTLVGGTIYVYALR